MSSLSHHVQVVQELNGEMKLNQLAQEPRKSRLTKKVVSRPVIKFPMFGVIGRMCLRSHWSDLNRMRQEAKKDGVSCEPMRLDETMAQV